MNSYSQRFEDALLSEVSNEIELRSDNLVTNRMMPARDVDYERGYIAALRNLTVAIQRKIPQKLNEEIK